MKKIQKISQLTDNPYLNLFHLDARSEKGVPFDYYFVSRNKKEKLKIHTKESKAEGVVIYAVLKENPEYLIMIRQYRYPIDDVIYELPAGLIDKGESAENAAVREMKEETGMDFNPVSDEGTVLSRPFYMGAGFTDETCQTVFGYAEGEISSILQEETEMIQAFLVNKKEALRILKEEKVSIRCAYLLMSFLAADPVDPFSFLKMTT